MQTQSESKIIAQRVQIYLFNFGVVAGLAVLAFGLASCGSGSSSTSSVTASTTPTITSITPAGIVASSVPQALSILGSNFTNTLSLTIANSSGVPYTITSSSVTSSTVLTANVTISSAPTDNYVSVTLQPATGTAATAVLGVAGTQRTIATDIQTIFDTNLCYSCHGTSGGLNLSSAIASSTGLINEPSIGCSQNLRVKAGDPRRTSSVLIDVLKAKTTTTAALACNTSTSRHMPQGTYPALSDPEIQAIIDWIAGGAN